MLFNIKPEWFENKMTDNLYLPEGSLFETAENSYFISSQRNLERAMLQERIIEGIVTMCDCQNMSLTVDLGGMTGIIPKEEALWTGDGSMTKDIAIITRVGKPVCFKVIGFSDEEDGEQKVILSRRLAQKECAENFIAKLECGDIIPARVTHLETFGAFVDIGCGIISLLTVDSISVSRISHPKDRFKCGDEIMAVVKTIDSDTGRIYMSHRELLGTWEENAAAFDVSHTVTGIVRSIEEYGIFVELSPNLAGLAEYKEGISVGDSCAVYIKSIIPERMKIKLVIIDAGRKKVEPKMKYYIDTNKIRHLSRWKYSPEGCSKVIETVFDESLIEKS